MCECFISFLQQAFRISIACLDGKIADRKGYEYLKKLTSGSILSGGGGSGSNSNGDLQELDPNEGRGKMGSGSGGRNNGSSNSAATEGQTTQARGSMTGSNSVSGMIRETLPSGQYLRDKITRTFK